MGYDDAYYRQRRGFHEWEARLARDFVARYAVTSMIDLGCGIGSFLCGAKTQGADPLLGLEYHFELAKPYIPNEILPFVRQADVTRPLGIGQFDCSWSVEVAEHVDPSGTDQFVKNLVEASNRLILLTAAPPGQGGTGHINCRPYREWVQRVTHLGPRFDDLAVSETVEAWRRLKCPGYILRNLMIFRK